MPEPSNDIHEPQFIPFKAETRQLLDILIHSLYTDRDVFIREMVSNASDALTRLSFELLTNRSVQDPDLEPGIWITCNPEDGILTIRDSGIGMTEAEMIEDLGTIAHSGARKFLEAAQKGEKRIADIIGQFGVGFYSAFMVAESIKVTSRSYEPDAQTTSWFSTGGETFSIEPAEEHPRGTEIAIKLKPDAKEYAQEYRIRQIVKKHSDYIPYPIYIGDSAEQVNQQTALWRQAPQEIKAEEYGEFYKQFTLDYEGDISHMHIVIDAPVQLYALLFIPSSPMRNVFSPRKQDGLQLFARKVLIQDYCQELLPPAFRFIQGIVDSEDLPLNVSRESFQSTRTMAKLKKLLTSKVISALKDLAENQPDTYTKFWQQFSAFIKEGIATDPEILDDLLPLLRFHSLNHPQEYLTLDEYIDKKIDQQEAIYYLLGDEKQSMLTSPHLEIFHQRGIDVLLMADHLDPFMLLRLRNYKDHQLVNVASEEANIPEPSTQDTQSGAIPPEEENNPETVELIVVIKNALGDKVMDVRTTKRLVESPARLVDPQGAVNAEMLHVYKSLDKDFETPKKILEVNPHHQIWQAIQTKTIDDNLRAIIIEQIFENALLIEGLHPNPANMISRIQEIIKVALQ